jgi:7-carboxy-7-deazaguanine synthase
MVETLMGELPEVGRPCVLVRLAGCNLACKWCDTTDNKFVRERVTVSELAGRIHSTGRELVMITGGEPLLCEQTPELIAELLEMGLRVVVETNGSLPLDKIPPDAIKSIDVKTPSSGHSESFLESNLKFITSKDTLKFVVANRDDFEWSLRRLDEFEFSSDADIVFSPVWGEIDAKTLAEWILETKMPFRLSIQIHKIIGIK